MSSEPRKPAPEKGIRQTPFHSLPAPQWKFIPSLGDDETRRLRIDCGTPQIAELVRQIDHHGQFGSLVECDLSEHPSDPSAASWIEMAQPPGEPLSHLIDRLGSRPPPVLVDAWCHQLAQIEATLDAAELPLHRGRADDLRVDSAARLHVAYLPLRIAESICEAEPECQRQGSLLPWLRSSQEIDLGGFDALESEIENLAPSPAAASPAAASPAAASLLPTLASAEAAIASAAVEVEQSASPRRRGGNRSRPAALRLWIAGAAATVIVIALAMFWSGRADQAPPGGADREAEPPPAAAAALDSAALDSAALDSAALDSAVLAAEAAPQQASSETRPPERKPEPEPRPAEPLFRMAELRESERAEGSERIPAPTETSATASVPVETSLRKMDAPAASERVAESNQSPAPSAQSPAASAHAFDLPSREQTEQLPIPELAGVAVAAMRNAVLQTPSGDEGWRLVAEKASTAEENAPELRVVSEEADGAIHTAAVLQNRTGETDTDQWSWAWTSAAAEIPGAEQLRNARLSIDGRQVYLRTTTTADAVRISFEGPQQTEEWSLVTAAAPRRSQITIRAETADLQNDTAGLQNEREEAAEKPNAGDTASEEFGEPLFVQWLQAVERAPESSVRGLAEIRESEEAAIAVRVRFDMQAGRSIRLETNSVATIEASSGWQPASHSGVREAQDRVTAQQMEIERLLQVIDRQYPRIEDREARSAMRARRETLEEQQKVLAEWTERLGQLQVLMSRIATELKWQIELRTEWPDESQAIFVSR